MNYITSAISFTLTTLGAGQSTANMLTSPSTAFQLGHDLSSGNYTGAALKVISLTGAVFTAQAAIKSIVKGNYKEGAIHSLATMGFAAAGKVGAVGGAAIAKLGLLPKSLGDEISEDISNAMKDLHIC